MFNVSSTVLNKYSTTVPYKYSTYGVLYHYIICLNTQVQYLISTVLLYPISHKEIYIHIFQGLIENNIIAPRVFFSLGAINPKELTPPMVTLYGTVLKSYCTNTVTSISYRELRLKVLQVLSSGEWYNIPYLAKLLNIDRANLHKIIKPLLKNGVIVKKKANGLSWIRLANKQLLEENRYKVDLILKTRVSQTPTRPNKRYVRANPYRLQALKVLANVNMLDNETWRVLNELFNAYMEDISRRAIILKHVDGDRWLWLPVKTRFSRKGIKKIQRKYNVVFDKATKSFKYAIWITFTADPKKYRNIIDMCHGLQKAWNRFMSYLTKRLGFRPKFHRTIEFTKSGLIHYHVLLFNVRRICDKKTELTPYLEKIGFGKINFLYQIVNRNGVWIPKKLLDIKDNTEVMVDGGGLPSNLKGYLSKYITKVFRDLDFDGDYPQVDVNEINPIVLYWALNVRFFTCSMDLLPETNYYRSWEWEFWGSGYLYNSIDYPLETDYPPWEYYVPWTYPPLYHVPEV